MAKANRIRIQVRSFDHRLIDEASLKIVEAAITGGAKVIGPVPLPKKRRLFVVTKSPFTDKNAREHFEMITHKRLIDVMDANLRTIDSLQHLDLPSGVEISIKM